MNTMNMAQLTIELDKIQRQIAAIQHYVMSLRGYQTIPHSHSYVALRSVRPGAQSRMSRLNPNAAEFHSQLNVAVEPKEKEPTEKEPTEKEPKEKEPKKPKKPKEQPIPLSSLLLEGEEVILRVNTGKRYEDGYPHFTTATTQYKKGVFTVTACESVPSMIGQSSDKPGTLLYQFVRELLRAKIIFRSFNIAPWKLCFVKRNGQHQSLYQLYQETLASSM